MCNLLHMHVHVAALGRNVTRIDRGEALEHVRPLTNMIPEHP